ncbi:DNA helicase II [compost metagenome]
MLEEDKDAHAIAMHVAKTSGLLHELYIDKTVEGVARHENVQELLNSIRSFVDNEENEDKSLGAFLQTVSLLTTADEEDDGDRDKVTMMTIHGAKGLEFKHVFVVGMEENLFPSQMMLKSRDDLEEERRLFYVAITRAEKQLTLSYAQQRYTWGKMTFCEPSRFLEEIDSRYLRQGDKGIPTGFEAPRKVPVSAPGPKAGEPVKRSPAATQLRPVQAARPVEAHVPSPDFTPSDTRGLKAGDRVEHPKFGFGEVKKTEQMGSTAKATILFEKEGEKTLLLSFAKLRIL